MFYVSSTADTQLHHLSLPSFALLLAEHVFFPSLVALITNPKRTKGLKDAEGSKSTPGC